MTSAAAISTMQGGLETVNAVVPLLNSLRRRAQRALDLTERIHPNEQECQALVTRAVELTSNALKHASAQEVDAMFLQSLEPGKSVIEEIEDFIEQQSRRGRLSRIFKSSETSNDIQRLNEKLDAALTSFQNALTISIMSTQRLQAESGTWQTARSQASQVPSDMFKIQLPPKPQIFYGRADEVERTCQCLLSESTARVAILGPGGMGKTSLAVTVLHDERIAAKFPRHRIFISCDGVTSADGIISVLAIALKLLDTDDPRHAVFLYFQGCSSAVVLVLDNLESAWDTADMSAVEDLLVELANIANLSLIVTMRGGLRPPGVAWSLPILPELRPLTIADARSIFVCIDRKDHDDDDNLDQLLETLDGLPLAITLMAYQGQVLNTNELLRAYERERTLLLKRGRNRRLTSLEVSIEVSLNSLTMLEHPHAQELLSLLSLLPDGFEIKQLSNIIPSMNMSGEAVRILFQVALASNKDGSLQILSPIRAFMLDNHPPQGLYLEELQSYYMRMTSLATDLGRDAPRQNIQVLAWEWGNINAILNHAWIGWPTIASPALLLEATLRLAHFSYVSSYGNTIPLLQLAIQQVEDVKELRWITAEFQHALGAMLSLTCHYDRAIESLEGTMDLFRGLGDQRGVARCMEGLGHVLYLRSQYDSAAEMLDGAKNLFETLDDTIDVANCLISLAGIHRMRYRHEEALSTFMEAQGLFDSFGSKLGVAQCVRGIGDILRAEDRYEEARENFEAAKRICEEIGSPLLAAQCTQSIGNILRTQCEYAEAAQMLTEAKELFVLSDNWLGQAQCTRSLADITRSQGRYGEATSHLKEASKMFEEVGYRLGVAQCMQTRGDTLAMQGQFDEATSNLEEAGKCFLTVGNFGGKAQCLYSQGSIFSLKKRWEEALQNYSEAHQLFEAAISPLGAARCVQRRGDILTTVERYDEAIPALTEAKSKFEALVDHGSVTRCTRLLGRAVYAQGSENGDLAIVTSAREMYESIDDVLGTAQCFESMGNILSEEGRNSEAAGMYEEALQLYEELGRDEDVEDCKSALEALDITDTATPN